ncbi:MAG: hypothetical protein PHU23_16060, partial [Dehalococcoidales bacterium]|nr:hypothetical protein [Dehalococcoidales bacterium]
MKMTDEGLITIFRNLPRVERARIAGLALFGLCLLILSLTYFGLSIGRSYIGVDLALDQRGWFVQVVDTPGLGSSVGIKVGDRPVEVNGQPAGVFLEKYEKVGAVWSPLIQELTVEDGQGNLKSTVSQGVSHSSQSVIELVMRFLACLVFWAIGIYVFLKRPQNAAANILYECCLLVALVLSANIAAVRGVQAAVFLEVGGTIIGPWLLLHFFLLLPEERAWIRNQPLIYLIYLPALVTL